MSDERPLNVRIAEARGWTDCHQVPTGSHWWGVQPEGGVRGLPLYGVTWADTGPLLEEMVEAGFAALVGDAMARVRLLHMNTREAIAATWLAWKAAQR